MALKLNLTITHLIGDPQVGFSPFRTYDENIAHVRETIADINNRHPGLGGMIMFLDNEKAFDRVPASAARALRAHKSRQNLHRNT